MPPQWPLKLSILAFSARPSLLASCSLHLSAAGSNCIVSYCSSSTPKELLTIIGWSSCVQVDAIEWQRSKRGASAFVTGAGQTLDSRELAEPRAAGTQALDSRLLFAETTACWASGGATLAASGGAMLAVHPGVRTLAAQLDTALWTSMGGVLRRGRA